MHLLLYSPTEAIPQIKSFMILNLDNHEIPRCNSTISYWKIQIGKSIVKTEKLDTWKIAVIIRKI